MLEVNVDEIIKKIPNYEKGLQVCQRSLNDAIGKAKTAASKATRSKYSITASRIREAESVKKASTSRLNSTVVYKSRMINMINYKVTPKKPMNGKGKQLKAGVKKGGLTVYKKAFVQAVNGFGVWRRTTNKRMPIAPIYGPAVSHLMNNDDTKKAFNDMAEKTYLSRFEHHMNRAMK